MASEHNLIENDNHLRKEGTDSKRGGYSASLSFPSFPHLPPLGMSPEPPKGFSSPFVSDIWSRVWSAFSRDLKITLCAQNGHWGHAASGNEEKKVGLVVEHTYQVPAKVQAVCQPLRSSRSRAGGG